jgi:NADH-quinone oxidoreductase subunit C
MPDFINEIKASYPDLEYGEVSSIKSVILKKSDEILPFLKFLKDSTNLRFTVLTDLFAADFPDRKRRFEIVYNLLSLEYNTRIIVKFHAAIDEEVPSVTEIFKAAGWYEREVFDMYGVIFSGSPDLRRILTDYGFVGHPLRKDFPLTGHLQVKYDETLQKVVYVPVSLDQDYRNFDFMSPWQGPNYVLPGDEKAGPQDPKLTVRK